MIAGVMLGLAPTKDIIWGDLGEDWTDDPNSERRESSLGLSGSRPGEKQERFASLFGILLYWYK